MCNLGVKYFFLSCSSVNFSIFFFRAPDKSSVDPAAQNPSQKDYSLLIYTFPPLNVM